MSGSRRTFSTEYKQEAVQLVTKQGLSAAEAASRLGIGTNLLRKWKQAHEQQGPLVASPRQPSALEAENARLRAENERLRMEREILKKATAFFVKELR
jgi:transposase